ncbi:hypothetical protein HYX06_04425 [Candidatus Woesearchaeota archaeon]|nr:hypothetical protein [Candidatus Woesearchaeota archaeon]
MNRMPRNPEDVGKKLNEFGSIRSMVIASEFPHPTAPASKASTNLTQIVQRVAAPVQENISLREVILGAAGGAVILDTGMLLASRLSGNYEQMYTIVHNGSTIAVMSGVGAVLGALGVGIYEALRTQKRSYSQMTAEHSDQNQQPGEVPTISH